MKVINSEFTNFLINSQIDEAINFLSNKLEDSNPDINKELTLISARYNRVESNKDKSLLGFDEYNVELNKIIEILINYYNSIDNQIKKTLTSSFTSLISDIKITLIGFVNSGKTTYINRLFNDLSDKSFRGYTLEPGDDFTINKLSYMQSSLNRGGGRFALTAPGTPIDIYNAKVLKEKLELGYDVKILDYSGEAIEDILCYGNWIQNKNHIVESNIIYVIVDLLYYLDDEHFRHFGGKPSPNQTTIRIISSLQTLRNSKFAHNQLQNEVIALVFLKCDITNEIKIKKENILADYKGLIDYIQLRYDKFQTFFVSSMDVGFDGHNRFNSLSINVPDLFFWSIQKLKSK